jgi:hypothetical protein
MKADDTAKLGGRVATNKKPGGIAVFLALTLSFSSIFYFLIANPAMLVVDGARTSVA